MTLQVFAIVVLGLMCGSELNVAALAHPAINRQPPEVQALMLSRFAALFGRVTPFWMAGSTLLNVLLLLPVEYLDKTSGSGANRSRDSSVRRAVFADWAGSHQQPDREMDAGNSPQRLEAAGAPLGSLPWAQNKRAGYGIRDSCLKRRRPLKGLLGRGAAT